MVRKKVYGPPQMMGMVAFPSCPGCGQATASKAIMEVLEELGIEGEAVGIIGVGCAGTTFHSAKIDVTMAAHGVSPALATGIKQALFDDVIVFTLQGDGDCAAIGAGYLVNAAARADKVTVFMFNNANYGTTGGQMAPTTLLDQITTTTPTGRDGSTHGYPLHIPEMLATIKGVAYSARGAISSPANYQRAKRFIKTAFQKQIDEVGFSFVEILVACPVNWHMTPVEAVGWIEDKMIAEFPLGEFKNVARIE